MQIRFHSDITVSRLCPPICEWKTAARISSPPPPRDDILSPSIFFRISSTACGAASMSLLLRLIKIPTTCTRQCCQTLMIQTLQPKAVWWWCCLLLLPLLLLLLTSGDCCCRAWSFVAGLNWLDKLLHTVFFNSVERLYQKLIYPSTGFSKGKKLSASKLLNSTQVAVLKCIIKSSLVGCFRLLMYGGRIQRVYSYFKNVFSIGNNSG